MHTTLCSNEVIEVVMYFQCLILQKSQNQYAIVVTMGQHSFLGMHSGSTLEVGKLLRYKCINAMILRSKSMNDNMTLQVGCWFKQLSYLTR